jgi:hypothetical protein
VDPDLPNYSGFQIKLRKTIFGKTALDKKSAGRGDLYLATHKTHKRQTSMPLAGVEPAISA